MVNKTPKRKITKSYSLQKNVADEFERYAQSCDESSSSALEIVLVQFLNAFGRIENMSDADSFNEAVRNNKNAAYTSNTGVEFLVTLNMSFVTAEIEDEE